MTRRPEKKKSGKPRKPAPSKPGLSLEDAALFDAAMRDVETISDYDDPPPASITPPPPQAPAAKRKSPTRRPPPEPPPNKKLPALKPGASADVDTRTLTRFKRGQMRPEGRLDLHGMVQTEAHRALNSYVAQAQSSGLRCIIVITGKGRVSEGGGVLRNQVPQWLNSPALRPLILAFTPAQPRDGGDGALYVLLRRKR
ncbi:MAG: DNA mismatch repair protein MutS [Rhodospirillaceae bacterium]|jgi:DNA-nicking Smr family endonuclease|nr:DNA mismatch repair protein MutS [Rhodospirillaceae bacterium]MBT5455882.1 DNA mismatch repair protein MutS [Rhodospirillaceae bacterium]